MTGTPGETDGQFLDDPGFEPAASFDRFYAGAIGACWPSSPP